MEIEAGKACRYMESPDGVFSWYLKMATSCGLHVVHECVDAAHSEILAQCMGVCDGMCASVSGHNHHGVCSWRLLQRVAFPEDALRLHFPDSLHMCPMTMNNGRKLWSSADARLQQLKSSKSCFTLTHTQESCTTPSCGPQPPGHVRFLRRSTSATTTVFLVQMTLACTRR